MEVYFFLQNLFLPRFKVLFKAPGSPFHLHAGHGAQSQQGITQFSM